MRTILRFFTKQRVPIAAFTIRRPEAELRILLWFALGYIALSGVTGQLILRWPLRLLGSSDFLLSDWYYLFFKITCLLVLPAVAFTKAGYSWRDLVPGGLGTRDWVYAAIAYTIGFFVNAAHLEGIGNVLRAGRMHAPAARILIAVVLALVNAGLPEEFVFRGLLQTRLEKLHGRLVAILGTAILFTAWHLPSRYFLASASEGQAGDLASVLLHTGLPVLIVALIIGLLWDRHRRLLALIALHWGVDTLPLISGILGIQR